MANMQKFCPKGHAYDSSLPACPYCSPSQNGDKSTKTDTLVQENNKYKLCPKGHYYPSFLTECPYCTPPPSPPPGVETLIDPQPPQPTTPPPPRRVRPVVGWLVCIQGPDIGKDFRLHSDFNRVGRAEYQDVCLSDRTVSREHFTVSYDKEHNRYFAEMGKGALLVRINGCPFVKATKLKRGDRIKVGETELVFIPLEQQDVKWTDEQHVNCIYELER